MFGLVFAVTLAAGTVKSVAVPHFSGSNVAESQLVFFAERLANELSPALQVTTPAEIQALMGLERQRQLLGCDEASQCSAELVGALGVDGVVLGQVAHVGSRWQLDVKVVEVRSGRRIASYGERLSSEDELLDAIDRGAKALVAELFPASTKQPSTLLRWSWVPTSLLGAAGAAVGTVFLVQGNSGAEVLLGERAPQSSVEALALKESSETKQRVGVALIVTGAALVVAAVPLFVLGRAERQELAVSLAVTPTGFVVSGVWP